MINFENIEPKMTFEEYCNSRVFSKIHRFSNSGKTDFGIKTDVTRFNDSIFLQDRDKVLIMSKCSELSKEEFTEHEEIIRTHYRFYCITVDCEEEELKDALSFIEENIGKLNEYIPFKFVNDYGVYRINCKDAYILESSPNKEINSIEDFKKLDKDEQYVLLKMLVNSWDSYENW